jgi:hypothetical protein
MLFIGMRLHPLVIALFAGLVVVGSQRRAAADEDAGTFAEDDAGVDDNLWGEAGCQGSEGTGAGAPTPEGGLSLGGGSSEGGGLDEGGSEAGGSWGEGGSEAGWEDAGTTYDAREPTGPLPVCSVSMARTRGDLGGLALLVVAAGVGGCRRRRQSL